MPLLPAEVHGRTIYRSMKPEHPSQPAIGRGGGADRCDLAELARRRRPEDLRR